MESELLDDLQEIMTAAERRTRGRTDRKRCWGGCGQVRKEKQTWVGEVGWRLNMEDLKFPTTS